MTKPLATKPLMTKLQKVVLSAWVLFIPYHFISARWSETINIRIDLLLIYLLLAILTVAVGIQWLIKLYKAR